MVSPEIIPVMATELAIVPGVALSKRTRLLFALLIPKIGIAFAETAVRRIRIETARKPRVEKR